MATAETSQETTKPRIQFTEAKKKALEIDKLFRICVKHKGSDLHLKVGKPPMIRFKGDIREMDLPPLSARDMERLIIPMFDDRLMKVYEEEIGADFAYVLGDNEARFRVNVMRQMGYLGLVARLINATILPFEGLYLPPVLGDLCLFHQGLIILAGITGSGKSTTIASMLDFVNHRRRCHILTIENPIEFVFTDDKAVINQREVGLDVATWSIALKHAMRQDPDVILVGEMRDRETFESGMHAAETGHLVYGTVHANTAPSAIPRIIDLFPADMHNAVRQNMAMNLKGIIAQKLVKTTPEWQAKGVGRVPINEIMICNASVRKAISECMDDRLGDLIRANEHDGMQDFTMHLVKRVESDMITRETAFEIAPNPESLKMALKGIKIPVSGLV